MSPMYDYDTVKHVKNVEKSLEVAIFQRLAIWQKVFAENIFISPFERHKQHIYDIYVLNRSKKKCQITCDFLPKWKV